MCVCACGVVVCDSTHTFCPHQPEFDHNCNGISGTDPQGRSYEDLYCAGTKQYGLAVLGDSASTVSLPNNAHILCIPQQLLTWRPPNPRAQPPISTSRPST
jgi:hypothetical protein